MRTSLIETRYPLSFRKTEAGILGEHLRNRHSTVLIGMKRVGISNFLRFFLYHKNIKETYITDGEKHLFIPVDLNDLIERELFPFWTLTLKRITDAIEISPLGKEIKKYVRTLFLESIQMQEPFLTVDNVRKTLVKIVESGFLPTIFFLRFDRLKEAFTPEFFANLQGLKEAAHQKLSYVFTSFRSLDILSPAVFPRASLSTLSYDIYIQPAKEEDIRIVLETYKSRYRLGLLPSLEPALFELIDGYIQYLQLALIALHERKMPIKDYESLFDLFINDERINLQSEELWESLTSQEQTVLLKIKNGKHVPSKQQEEASYLWKTGFVIRKDGKAALFSPLLASYSEAQEKKNLAENNTIEFTRKENLLFALLSQNLNEICERERIIEAVWPEVKAFGVSDWAIDRLVSRVRNKLKLKSFPFEIQTIKTRGYKLIEI